MRQFKFNSLACRHHFLHDLERNAAADGNVVYAHSLKRDALYALTNVANVTQDHANPRAKIRTIGLSVSLSDAVFHLITNSGNCREPMFLLHALRPQADYFANTSFVCKSTMIISPPAIPSSLSCGLLIPRHV